MRQVAGSPLLSEAIQEFIIDRRLRNLSPQTIEWYEKRLGIVRPELNSPPLCDLNISTSRSTVPEVLLRPDCADFSTTYGVTVVQRWDR
jgi:hypothetical protein